MDINSADYQGYARVQQNDATSLRQQHLAEQQALRNTARSGQSGISYPRLMIDALPQGGFIITSPARGPDRLDMPIGATTTLDEALAFVRQRMGG